MGEWTSVKEGLPEPFKTVLITFEHDQYGTKEKTVVTVGMAFHNGRKWNTAISAIKAYKTFKVLAWMPVPEIWKGQ